MRRGQISFEYLMIVGLALLIIVPSIMFFLSYSKSGGDRVSHSRISEIGLEMNGIAADVYALGKHAWLTLDVNMPDNIENIYISSHNELVIKYWTQYGLTSAVFFPKVTLTNADDNLITTPNGPAMNLVAEGQPGVMSFRFTSQGKNISISVVDPNE